MKKEKTLQQQKNKERVIQYSLFASEFVAIPTPFIIMGAVNFNEWFAQNPDGWKIGLGGSIAIALCSLAALLVAKSKENKELTGGYITIIMIWYTLAFITMLLAQILTEISNIMLVTGSGLCAAFGLDIGSKEFKKRADKHQAALIEAEKDLDKERAKEDMIRVRIK